jgi:hypothetical protein
MVWSLLVYNIRAAVGDATILTRCRSSRSTSLRLGHGAEFSGHTALALDVTTSIQLAGVQISEFLAFIWCSRSGNLWATHSIGHRLRHRRVALTKTHSSPNHEIAAACPSPHLLIESFQVVDSKTIGSGYLVAAIISDDCVRGTGAIQIGLWSQIGKITR